jgi:FMN-dependent NADH-azoreductase
MNVRSGIQEMLFPVHNNLLIDKQLRIYVDKISVKVKTFRHA